MQSSAPTCRKSSNTTEDVRKVGHACSRFNTVQTFVKSTARTRRTEVATGTHRPCWTQHHSIPLISFSTASRSNWRLQSHRLRPTHMAGCSRRQFGRIRGAHVRPVTTHEHYHHHHQDTSPRSPRLRCGEGPNGGGLCATVCGARCSQG